MNDYLKDTFWTPDAGSLSICICFCNQCTVDISYVMYYHLTHTRRVKSQPVEIKNYIKLYLIILSGDIASSPGHIRYPCGGCYRPVAKNHRAIYCEGCYFWWHIKCVHVTPVEYNSLANSEDPWLCRECSNFHFTDSFFSNSYISIDDSYTSADSEKILNNFEPMTKTRQQHPRRFICACLNINSLRNKFYSIQEILIENTVDLLFILETKLDDSFPNSQFAVDNYHMWRADRNSYGGGIIAYLRSDIAGERRPELEFKGIESICIEVQQHCRGSAS
ncbi:uncharacterized protein LOC128559078 [Mercenaria mercenaria]|uniref:uncharacterized protein LOC128559078 n=1 Tax=Mercenaria mercenaria TaxID=6596 RepID=UPI00234E7184|nr:uncharacterized protein LOC128559078 [Mercenaria mercenaria]